MSLMKGRGDSFVSYGEGLMGFALIFLGLEYLAKAIPDRRATPSFSCRISRTGEPSPSSPASSSASCSPC